MYGKGDEPGLRAIGKWVKLPTWNLSNQCVLTISPNCTNKTRQKGHGLGHVTPIKFGTRKSILVKPGDCLWQLQCLVIIIIFLSLQTKSIGQTWHVYRYGPLVDLITLTHFQRPWPTFQGHRPIFWPENWKLSPNCTNKTRQKGHGLGHVTPIKFGTRKSILVKPGDCLWQLQCLVIIFFLSLQTKSIGQTWHIQVWTPGWPNYTDPLSATLTHFSRSQTHFWPENWKHKIHITLSFMIGFWWNFVGMDPHRTPSCWPTFRWPRPTSSGQTRNRPEILCLRFGQI